MKIRTASGAASKFFRSQPSFATSFARGYERSRKATKGFSSPLILVASREVFGRRRIKNGFGLVELLVVIFIISLSLIYIFGIVSQLTRASGNSYLAYQANLINESNFETIRALRDSSWTDNIAPLINGSTYYTRNQDGIVSLAQTDPGIIYQNFQSSIIVGAVYRDGNGNIASSGTLDTDIKKFTSTTSWTFREQNKSAQAVYYLGNIIGN